MVIVLLPMLIGVAEAQSIAIAIEKNIISSSINT